MRRARRNPQSADALEHPFVVLVRRFDPTSEELPRWEPLCRDDDGRPEFFSEARAKSVALNPPRDADLHVGDLVTVVPVEAISDIDNQAHRLFVVTPNGIHAAPGVPKNLGEKLAWTAAWGQNAQTMLAESGCVDRRRLVLAACDCAETAIRLVPDGEERPRVSLETARAWCLGRATWKDVQKASDEARYYALSLSSWDDSVAANAAIAAANAARDELSVVPFAAANAAKARASVTGVFNRSAYADALRGMAPLVERWIPLPVLLLSMLRYPNAIPLNLDGVQSAEKPRSNPGHRNHNTPRGRR